MNRNELIRAISDATDFSLTDTGNFLQAFIDVVTGELASNGTVTLVGFGTWSTRVREAREGINPQNRKPIQIPASTVVKFKVGKGLKDAVNDK
jgi:DNA-binding protein HU-beta